jgi:nucleotide-binding universal stress UspA family protein
LIQTHQLPGSRHPFTWAYEGGEAMTKQILFATDFSPASAPAFRRAIAVCRERGASLLVAHVLEPPVPFTTEGYVLPQIYDEIAVAVRDAAEKKMRRALDAARKKGVSARGLLLRGSPHQAIARAAKAHRVAQVVVGTHGRSGFSRLLLGSVAARVIAASPCPVLVIPASKGGASS